MLQIAEGSDRSAFKKSALQLIKAIIELNKKHPNEVNETTLRLLNADDAKNPYFRSVDAL